MSENTAEWAARLTADDCMALVHATLEAGDVKGFDAALRLLSTKDAHRAADVLDMVRLGLDISERSQR